MPKEIDAATWRKRLDRTKKIRKPYIEDRENYINMYTNATSEKKNQRRDLMQVNYIYSHIRTVSPSIFAGKPHVNVLPKQPGLEEPAHLLGKSIDYWGKKLGAVDEFKTALFDSFFGLAAVEVGWDYRTQIAEEMVPQAMLDENGVPAMGGDGIPMMQMAKQQVEKVKVDQPFLRWRDAKDIFLDCDVPRRKDGRYMMIRDVVSHDYFMNMTDIPQELRDKVKPTIRPEDMARADDVQEKRSKDVSSDSEWVELEWIWCRESMQRYLVTPSLPNEFLLITEWPYDIEFEDDPFPVTILDSITDNRYPYSWSEFRPVIEHIREVNRIRTNMQYHMKASQPKYLYRKGALTRAQAAKWANARPDELIEAQNPEGIIQAPLAQLPAELLGWNQMVEDDIKKQTGLIEYEASVESKTATEASILEGRSSVRKKARSQEFEQFVTKVYGKLGMLLQQFQNQAIAIQIDAEEGSQWANVSKEQIQGEFMYEIEPGIMEFKNEAVRKQQLMKYTELMQNNPNVDQRKLAVQITKQFDMSPDGILKPLDQMVTPPQEPKITFKPIDLLEIPEATAQMMIVKAAMQQNDVLVNGTPPPPPLQGPELGPQDTPGIMGDGQSPMAPRGGMVDLPPVEGNAEVQDMSRNYQ